MAKKDLIELLIKLFGDPKFHERVGKDPDAELAKLGLTKEERALLTSRDEKALRSYLGNEAEKVLIVTQWFPTGKK